MICERIGSVFSVRDFPPTPVVEMGVGKFMGNDIARKCVGAVFKSRLKDNATTGSARPKEWHHDRSTFPWLAVVQRDSKIGIRQKVRFDILGKRVENVLDLTCNFWEFGESSKVRVVDCSTLR